MYRIYVGTVKGYVVGEPNFFVPFGRAQYDSRKPVISKREYELVRPIVSDLNDGKISENEAKTLLERI